MSGGMVPGKQQEGKAKLIVIRDRKGKSSMQQLNFADHPPGHVMTVTRILVSPSIVVERTLKSVSFTRFPISGGMVPGKQRGGETKLVVVRGRKTNPAKKQLIRRSPAWTCDRRAFRTHPKASPLGKIEGTSGSRASRCLTESFLDSSGKTRRSWWSLEAAKQIRQKSN